MTTDDGTKGPADTCRPVEVDGEAVRVHGDGPMTDEDLGYFAEVVRAAKRKYLAERAQADPS